MITRADDGSGEATEMREADDSEIASHARSSGTAILLAEEDIKEIGASLVPDVGGAVRPAVRRSGAERLGSGRIPTQALIRIGRSRPPGRVERSMKMGPFRNRGDRPRLPRGGHERRAGGVMTAAKGARTVATTAVTGRMTPRPWCRTRAVAAIALRRDERMILPARDGPVALRRTFIRHRLQSLRRHTTECDRCAACIPADALETSTSLRDRRQWAK